MTKTPLAVFFSPAPLASVLAQRIEVTVPSTKPLNGHLILVLAKSDKPEPRMQLSETYDSAEGFGVDAENLAPGSTLVMDAKTFGYPRRSLADLDAGDYYVQAVFNVYEQFHLASGKTVWLPPDKGEGQHWNLKARQSLQQAAKDPLRSEGAGCHQAHARPDRSAH